MSSNEETRFSLFSRKKAQKTDMPELKIPVHLAVIMDGNGRWAKKRMLPRSAGHRAGADNLKNLCKNCGHYGIKYVTVYAFSTENWSRPESEVHTLMELIVMRFLMAFGMSISILMKMLQKQQLSIVLKI